MGFLRMFSVLLGSCALFKDCGDHHVCARTSCLAFFLFSNAIYTEHYLGKSPSKAILDTVNFKTVCSYHARTRFRVNPHSIVV